MISIGHLLLNKSVIDITLLSLYCVSATALRVKFIYLPLNDNLSILRSIGSIRSTNSLFCGIYSSTLAGNLP